MFGRRRRRSFKLRLPFLKIKINTRTFANIIGFVLFGAGFLFYLSFIQSGDVLIQLNGSLRTWFGILSLLFPLIIMFLGTHFFNTKKLKIIKPNITLGL